MPIFAVTYEYDEREALRDEIRPAHRSFLRSLYDAGVLLASGPLGTTGAGALIVLHADGPDDALGTLAEDPFWVSGVVADRHAREWKPVIGPWA